jgi:hypothetical protein
MKIELQRRMNVETWDVKATLAFPQRRDEVQALLKMVLEKGALTASDVVHRQQGLLPGRAKIMGERLLTMVADLNLLKQDGERWSLTELGQASVEEGQTYVPEDDLWRFHWSDDPLVKSPLLHVQRIPPGNRWDRDNTPTKPTTDMHARGPVVRDLLHPVVKTRRVRVDSIAKNGHSVGQTTLSVSVSAEPGQAARLLIKGNLPKHGEGGTKVEASWPMNAVRHEDLLSELFADLPRGEWNGHALLVPFDGMSNKERSTQMTTVTVDDPVVDDLGEFDVVRIQQVPLLPATQDDAVAWATWLVWDRWQATPWPEDVSVRWTDFSDGLGVDGAKDMPAPRLSERIAYLKQKGEDRSPTEQVALMRAHAVMDLGGGEA